MANHPSFLVIDGYRRDGREALAAGGATPAGELYEKMLKKCHPGCSVDIVYPADPGVSLPEKGSGHDKKGGESDHRCVLESHDADCIGESGEKRGQLVPRCGDPVGYDPARRQEEVDLPCHEARPFVVVCSSTWW